MNVEKVVVITGAAGSVGSAIAHKMLGGGWAAVLVDTVDTHELAMRLRAEFAGTQVVGSEPAGGEVLSLRMDLSDNESVSAAVAQALAWKGHVDSLVNSAGIQLHTPLESMDPAEWDAVFAVNLRAPMLLSKGFASSWGKSKAGGSIINIVSRTWATGGPPAYVSSKAALVGLTRSLSVSLGPVGVRVNAVAPSFMLTGFTRRGRTEEEMDTMVEHQRSLSPLGRIATVQDVANAVSFLASDDASFITGEVLHVCGGTQLAAHA